MSEENYQDLQDWFSAFKADANASFNAWFSELQGVLDEDAETHILNLINSLTERVTMLESVVFNDISTNQYLIRFENLEGLKVNGVWNQTLQRIEC